ncbi:MAG: 50S ribosomal protein L24 [Clostridiales bacterium]
MKKEKVKMHVKTGDNVVVISGKDSGKKGKILSVDTKNGRVFVDKANLASRHTKPTQAAPQGGIIKKEASMDSSNVLMFCTKCNKGVRTRKSILDNGKKIRVCAVCGAHFDKE